VRTGAKVKALTREADIGGALGGPVVMVSGGITSPTGLEEPRAVKRDVVTPKPLGRARKIAKNSRFNWDRFNSQMYLKHNYLTLRGDDHFFIEEVRDFFSQFDLPAGATGVDIGAGANLYPAFAMLPFVRRLTLLDYSSDNIRWLVQQTQSKRGFDETWEPFWEVFREQEAYKAIDDPRVALRQRAEPRYGDLFKYSPRERHDIGTMFFVAESITSSRPEFKKALECFMAALKPGAPFAAAFMENSAGYSVGEPFFPAVRVSRHYIQRRLALLADGLQVYQVSANKYGALRAGYEGMVLAVGRAKQ
jgi:hypothetical protein